MADILKEIARLPQTVEAKLSALSQSVGSGIETTKEILETMYGVFSTVGNFFAWMGLHAMLLLIATMIALYLIGIISPLERRVNYLIALAVGSFLAYVSAFPIESYGRYLLVMAMPVLITYVPMLIWKGVRKMIKKSKQSPSEEKAQIVSELMEGISHYHKEGDALRLKEALAEVMKRLE